MRPGGDRPSTSAAIASRSRPPIGRSDDRIAPWGRWVILHLCATSRSLSGPADRAARTGRHPGPPLSSRGDSRQPALPGSPCEPDREVTLPGADDAVGPARRRERACGAGDYEGADRIRAEIRAGGWEPRDRPGGTALIPVGAHAAHPTLEATRPVRSHPPARAHRQQRHTPGAQRRTDRTWLRLGLDVSGDDRASPRIRGR